MGNELRVEKKKSCNGHWYSSINKHTRTLIFLVNLVGEMMVTFADQGL